MILQHQSINITDNCPICMDTITNGFHTKCNHIFCASCLSESLLRNPTCPICRCHNIHTCRYINPYCTLCVSGHRPGIIRPNVFNNDNNLNYSQFAYMTYYEIKILIFKVIALFTIQIFASLLCIKNIISLAIFCVVCFITTIINILVISRRSSIYCRYCFYQILTIFN